MIIINGSPVSEIEITAADVNAQADAALSDIKLDHLMSAAASDTSDPVNMIQEVVANSILSNILTDDGNTVDYDRRTMSLEALAYALEYLEEHNHSRQRTYPYLSAGIGLTAHNTALTMGTIVEIIPSLANEQDTMQITHACDVSGNVLIDLNGVPYVKAVVAGAGVGDTADLVAAQLRAYTYGDWTVAGATDKVIFTRSGLSTTAVFKDIGTTTKVTAIVVKTTTGAGVHREFDIHGVQLGLMGNTDTYILTLYSGLAGYEERICSRRITTATNNNVVGGETSAHTPKMPAGTRISASLASVAGGASKTAVISLAYHWYE